jgi:hypothetical protein
MVRVYSWGNEFRLFLQVKRDNASESNINIETLPSTADAQSGSHGRIMNKGILKIKSFEAQKANKIWKQFNHGVSALVNEKIDEFQGSSSLPKNFRTSREQVFHNNLVVMSIA